MAHLNLDTSNLSAEILRRSEGVKSLFGEGGGPRAVSQSAWAFAKTGMDTAAFEKEMAKSSAVEMVLSGDYRDVSTMMWALATGGKDGRRLAVAMEGGEWGAEFVKAAESR